MTPTAEIARGGIAGLSVGVLFAQQRFSSALRSSTTGYGLPIKVCGWPHRYPQGTGIVLNKASKTLPPGCATVLDAIALTRPAGRVAQ